MSSLYQEENVPETWNRRWDKSVQTNLLKSPLPPATPPPLHLLGHFFTNYSLKPVILSFLLQGSVSLSKRYEHFLLCSLLGGSSKAPGTGENLLKLVCFLSCSSVSHQVSSWAQPRRQRGWELPPPCGLHVAGHRGPVGLLTQAKLPT